MAELISQTTFVTPRYWPRSELCQFWRQFGNRARFMQNVRSVQSSTPLPANWVAVGAGDQSIEWAAVITEDIPDELIPGHGHDSFSSAPAAASNPRRFELAKALGAVVVNDEEGRTRH